MGDASTPRVIVVEEGLETCKGEYSLAPTVHHGRPVWRKAADPLRYLFFSVAEKTWFISDELEDCGFEKAVTDAELPLGMRWSKGAEVSAGADGSRDAATPPGVLRLAGGLESCNGEYSLTSQQHNDRPVWKKVSEPVRLLFFSEVDKTWYISDEIEDQGFDKTTTDVHHPLGLRWLKGSVVRGEGDGGVESQAGGGGAEQRAPEAPELIFAEGGLESCQGEFKLTPTVHNGRPVWKKVEDPKRLLFFSAVNQNWYISDEFEDQGFDSAPASGEEDLLPFGLDWEKGISLTTPKMREEKKVADALTSVRAVVEDIRLLKGQEGKEAEIKEASSRLAGLLRDARAAGVPDEKLLEASTPSAQPASGRSWETGDQVQIFGLASEQGRPLNGKVGSVKGYSEEKGRFEVELKDGKVLFAKGSNLRSPAQPQEEPLKAGDRVEIFGLSSESGSKLNGREGTISEFVADKERFKVELSPGEFVSIKPANLRAMAPPPSPEKRSASRSSSSSSSSKKRRKKTKRNLTPDEMMEKLLTGKAPPRPPKPPKPDFEESADASARAAGAAAAKAAAAAASLKKGDLVEVFGLQSEAGKGLNGKTGIITKWDEAKGRFQVELGQANLQSLKPDNLRKSSPLGASGGANSGVGGGPEPGYQGPSAGYTLL